MNREELQRIREEHVKWVDDPTTGKRANLSEANLSRANLSGANLSRANLSGANLSWANLSRADLSGDDLSRADLSGADLSGANLSRADLIGANLIGADLIGANLSGADLSRADLGRADLSGADLSGAILPTEEIWEEYCAETVPWLFQQGLGEIPKEAWECHDWLNCPMHHAFGINSAAEAPSYLRHRVGQWVQLFDAGFKEVVPEGNA